MEEALDLSFDRLRMMMMMMMMTHIKNHTYMTQTMQLAKEVLYCRVCQATYGSQIRINLVVSM